ncbi:MAG: GMP synthase [Bacteroidota bacterium]
MQNIKIAILDMYNGTENQGMRNIHQILDNYAANHRVAIQKTVFDIRGKQEKPTLDYDIYISSGGPGSPVDNEGWEKNYIKFVKDVMKHNKTATDKKHIFFICHSFQVMCQHFNLGDVCLRKSESFGTYPVFSTDEGLGDLIFKNLPRPFYIVDSRKWQVIAPNDSKIEKMGAQILALEKLRPHVSLERALMAIRFSPEMVGTQFHPEADAEGMLHYWQSEEKKQLVIENHGIEKYNTMIATLHDEDKIMLTQSLIIPQFLDNALLSIQQKQVSA